MDMEKVVDNLTDLKEMLKWQKDIKGYGFYIDFINDAISMLKEQDNEIDTLKTLLLGYETGAIEGNNDAINQNRRLYVDG